MLTAELQKKTLELVPRDRIRLVELLLQSLDKPDPEIDEAWFDESERRYADYRAGKTEGIDIEDLKI